MNLLLDTHPLLWWILEGLTIVTRDRTFDAYDVQVLRC